MSDKIEEKILDFQQVEVNITTNKLMKNLY